MEDAHDGETRSVRHIVVFAASAGGLEALGCVFGGLPEDFEAAIVAVMHLQPDRKSNLPDILSRRTKLKVQEAQAGDLLRPGVIFIAAPDHHVIIDADHRLTLSSGDKVHHSRPAADPLFTSAAFVFGDRAIGVVLTGGDGDGSDGISHIKSAGGRTIAQNEATSQQFSMPRNAIATNDVDLVLPIEAIAAALVRLVRGIDAT